MQVPRGFGTPDRYEVVDWVIRTACRLVGGLLSYVPVAKSSEHVRRSAVFSELRCTRQRKTVQNTCPPPGKAELVIQGTGVRSHEG